MTNRFDHDQGDFHGQEDELFTPSLHGNQYHRRSGRSRPWRVRSQMWIAFFGGSLALTAIAFINSRRLNINLKQQALVILVGSAAFLLTLGAVIILDQTNVDEFWLRGSTGFRLIIRVIALIAYLVMARIQRSRDRIYQFGGGNYSSLWWPGFLAVLLLGTIQNFILSILFA